MIVTVVSRERMQAVARKNQSHRRRRRTNVDVDGLSLGERLKNARLACGLSQIELSERAGLSMSSVRALEWEDLKGDRIHAHTVHVLADALGVTMTWLWTGEQEASA